MSKKMIVMVLMLCPVVAGVAAPAQGQVAHALSSLQGAYVYQGIGTIDGVDSPSVGRIVFDGVGGCTNSIRLNLGGTVFALTAGLGSGGSCTYSVDQDGIGFGRITATFADAEGNLLPAFFIQLAIVDDDEFLWVATDAVDSTIARGTAKAQLHR